MSEQKDDKEYYYDLVLVFKLSPKEWNIIPRINSLDWSNISLFRFELLFFSIDLQRWEDLSFDDFVKEDKKKYGSRNI